MPPALRLLLSVLDSLSLGCSNRSFNLLRIGWREVRCELDVRSVGVADRQHCFIVTRGSTCAVARECCCGCSSRSRLLLLHALQRQMLEQAQTVDAVEESWECIARQSIQQPTLDRSEQVAQALHVRLEVLADGASQRPVELDLVQRGVTDE